MDSSNDAVEMIRRMMVSDIGNLSSVYRNEDKDNRLAMTMFVLVGIPIDHS